MHFMSNNLVQVYLRQFPPKIGSHTSDTAVPTGRFLASITYLSGERIDMSQSLARE
jgi:hypothetical protein